MTERGTSLVLDIGTVSTRAGFGGDDSPQITFPTVVGT